MRPVSYTHLDVYKRQAFNRFALDGGVEVFPSELLDGAEKTDCYVSPEEYKALTENPFVLGEAPVQMCIRDRPLPTALAPS